MYSCPFCCESYVSIICLKAHCKLKHCLKLHSSFPCRQKSCHRVFSDIHTLFQHLAKIHSDSSQKIGNSNHEKISITRNDIFKTNRNIIDNKDVFNEDITYDLLSDTSSTDMSTLATSLAINSTAVNITAEEFAERVAQVSARFVAKLYSQSSLPRIFCQEIINSMKSFLDYVTIIEQKYKSIHLNPEPDFSYMLNSLKTAFVDYSSEHRTMVYFKNLETLIEPQEISIGASIDSRRVKTGKQLVVIEKKICIIPLDNILKKFLELPNVYNEITSNI